MSRYSGLRNELEVLQGEFEQQVPFCAGLQFDLIYGPDGENWSDVEFAEFELRNCGYDAAAWEEWRLWPSRVACSRYSGLIQASRRYVRICDQLADRGGRLLREFLELPRQEIPTGAVLSALRSPTLFRDGFDCAWLQLIHEWSYRFPSARLVGEIMPWRFQGPAADADQIAERNIQDFEGSPPYHPHPLYIRSSTDLFTASAAFIGLCLEPSAVLDLGSQDGPLELVLPPEVLIPYWLPEAGRFGELWFGDFLVRQFRKEPESQAVVLGAFQAANWPPEISNPFEGNKDYSDPHEALRNAVDGLNGRHAAKGIIKFGTEDNRSKVWWTALKSLE